MSFWVRVSNMTCRTAVSVGADVRIGDCTATSPHLYYNVFSVAGPLCRTSHFTKDCGDIYFMS